MIIINFSGNPGAVGGTIETRYRSQRRRSLPQRCPRPLNAI